MELVDFLRQTQAQVRVEIGDRLGDSASPYPYPETVFAEVVMQHMSDIGMTFDAEVCHFERRVGNANLRLTGFAVSEDADQIDLFVSIYAGLDDVTPIPDTETKRAAEQCLHFLAECAKGKLAGRIGETEDAYRLALTIQECYANLDQIRIYVITDRQAKAKNFKDREVSGKTIKLEVVDIERLHRHWSEGKPRDELVINFSDLSGGAIPCVYIPGEMTEYDYALTVFPGEVLRSAYDKYGARLLEANVRSYLSTTGKVNRGIRDTLKANPERFMAYNNGIVVVADHAEFGKTEDGGPGILWLRGMQIVNGGQTTASLYFCKKKNPDIDLRRVRVPAKIIILRSTDAEAEEDLIVDISRFANSQNKVRDSDLSANRPFHVELEKLAMTTYCPDGVGRWFYERAAGSYNVMLAREGSTAAKLRILRETVPTSRKVTKTELAKYLNVWSQRPDLAGHGWEKNFGKFQEQVEAMGLPNVVMYKQTIAKAIIFRRAQALVRPMFKAFQANVTSYLVALLANRLEDRFDLEKVWQQQDISPKLRQLMQTWAVTVHEVLHSTADGRMVSEWAKKLECWEAVRAAKYEIAKNVPELSA
jgi:hypothetical protein